MSSFYYKNAPMFYCFSPPPWLSLLPNTISSFPLHPLFAAPPTTGCTIAGRLHRQLRPSPLPHPTPFFTPLPTLFFLFSLPRRQPPTPAMTFDDPPQPSPHPSLPFPSLCDEMHGDLLLKQGRHLHALSPACSAAATLTIDRTSHTRPTTTPCWLDKSLLTVTLPSHLALFSWSTNSHVLSSPTILSPPSSSPMSSDPHATVGDNKSCHLGWFTRRLSTACCSVAVSYRHHCRPCTPGLVCPLVDLPRPRSRPIYSSQQPPPRPSSLTAAPCL